jgi:hypothetical protein
MSAEDPVDLFNMSCVNTSWLETVLVYLSVGKDFEPLTERTKNVLYKGAPGVLTCLSEVVKQLPVRKLAKDNEEETRFAYNLIKANDRPEVVPVLKWLGLTDNHICYLAAWIGNKPIFDLTKGNADIDRDWGYYCGNPGEMRLLNSKVAERDMALFLNTSIGAAALAGGNLDIIHEVGIHEAAADSGGNGSSQYDLAAISCKPEVVWLTFLKDFETNWEHANYIENIYEKDVSNMQDPYKNPYGNCVHPNPDFFKTYMFLRYLDPCNNEPMQESDDEDDWQYEKLKWLIETYPNWTAVQTIFLFKKLHFYRLIEDNLDSIKGPIPEKFLYPGDVYHKDEENDPPYDWLIRLLKGKGHDTKSLEKSVSRG